jgi:hypothetical protein
MPFRGIEIGGFWSAGFSPEERLLAIGYENGTVKVWNNRQYRSLPVTNFSVILPISVPEVSETPIVEGDRALVETLTSNEQVAELADEFAVFQGETKNALTAVVSVVAVIGVLLLFINLVLIIK